MDGLKARLSFRNRYVLLGDVILILVSVMGSFALRLDSAQLPYYIPAMLLMCLVALLIKIPTYYFFGLYRRMWIYASTSELRSASRKAGANVVSSVPPSTRERSRPSRSKSMRSRSASSAPFRA